MTLDLALDPARGLVVGGRRPRRGGPRTVLFVERTIGFGGSTVGLAQIVARLDRARFRPVVAVSHASQRDHLLAQGCGDVEIAVVPSRLAPAPPPATGGPFGRAASRVRGTAAGVADDWVRVRPWMRDVERFTAGRRIDLVHLNNSVSVNRGGIALAQRLGIPCIVKQRGFEWHSWGVRRLVPHVAWFMPDSCSVAADLERLGAPRDRILVTYCAVDPATPRGDGDAADVRAELGVPASAPTFGIVGQLLEWKGQRVFLDAAAEVIRRVPDARAVVVGGTPDGAPTAYSRGLEDLARRLGIAERVTFTGHRRDVPRLFRALDVVVHASIAPEPFGTVVAEALAAGRPVVAAAAGGPAEYVVPGRTGLLAQPGDAVGLARSVETLLTDRVRARAMAEEGRATVLRRFSVDRHVALTEEVFEEVLAAEGATLT